MAYVGAVAVVALTYYVLMNIYTPELVMTTVDGVEKVDTNRVKFASAAVGLVIVLGYQYYYKN